MIITQLIMDKEFESLKLSMRLESIKTKPKFLSFWYDQEVTSIVSKVRDLERELGELRQLKECLHKAELVINHPEPISWMTSDVVAAGFSVVSVQKEGNNFVHKYTLVK